MEFSIDARTARLSVGELADFQIGPRESGDGQQGIWRAQLGVHWHQQLRGQLTAAQPNALFELPLAAEVMHRGWRIALNGRIDQLVPPHVVETSIRGALPAAKLREIKTVMRPLPAAEEELRAEYPSYFAQLATYLALARLKAPIHESLDPGTQVHGELVFVEAGSGLTQTIAVTAADEAGFVVQLERLVEFLDLRKRARDRLRGLHFHPAFPQLRRGQETIQEDLRSAVIDRRIVLLEAPTGFGKTGAILEFALHQLKAGKFERILYLTSKSTGQLQVVHQLSAMTDQSTLASVPADEPRGVAAWHVRNKREHCVNSTFQCMRETCRFLQDTEARWKKSGLSRFYLLENQPRSLDHLREAGAQSLICPYEITRTSLAFNDVWIGDYNYVFSPSSRGLFYGQPGFEPARTLLVVDEAHNLPQRVADVYSQSFNATDAISTRESLHRIRANGPLTQAWDHWTDFLQRRAVVDTLSADQEDDARHLLDAIAQQVNIAPLDYVELGPQASEQLWQIPSFSNELATELPRLWWSPRAGELMVTCLDAAAVIGPTLRSFGAAILATATLGPEEVFTQSCGLTSTSAEARPAETPLRLGGLNRRDTKSLFKQLSTGASLLEADAAQSAEMPILVRAHTPWREQAYDVAIDVRVDTTFQQRQSFFAVTAKTIEEFCRSQAMRSAQLADQTTSAVAVFFPSYSYAEAIQRELNQLDSNLHVAIQPRSPDLSTQRGWAEKEMASSGALFLVLGSSFSEGVDFLGGKIGAAIVVGPSLPEVNAVQRARIESLSGLGKTSAFRRVYQVPGIQKVNQALGRLVRAPGQHARILLHCRRFAESSYASLLAPEYQGGKIIASEDELTEWMNPPTSTPTPPDTTAVLL